MRTAKSLSQISRRGSSFIRKLKKLPLLFSYILKKETSVRIKIDINIGDQNNDIDAANLKLPAKSLKHFLRPNLSKCKSFKIVSYQLNYMKYCFTILFLNYTTIMFSQIPPMIIEHNTRAQLQLNRSAASAAIEQNDSGGALRLQSPNGQTLIQMRTYGDSYFNGGSLGIGLQDPTSDLHIKGNNPILTIESQSDNPKIQYTNNALFTTNGWVTVFDINDDDQFKWRYDNISKMSLNTNGVLWVDNGITTTSSDVAVNATSETTAFRGTTTGPSTTAAFFDGAGSFNTGVFARGFTGVQGYGSSDDFRAVGPGIDYSSNSSKRWKSGITNLTLPLEKLDKLRGVRFDWDESHGGRHDIGMIAEEVAQIFPEIVSYDQDGVGINGMDYSRLTPFLIEVNKAQQAIIEQLNTTVRQLENRVARLEDQ